MVDVIQADREAAAAISPHRKQSIKAGILDDLELVQAFARHRLASAPQPEEETMERVAEVLDAWIGDLGTSRDMARAAIAALSTPIPSVEEREAIEKGDHHTTYPDSPTQGGGN